MSTTRFVSLEEPVFYHQKKHLIPVNDCLSTMQEIPPSRMFLIKKSLAGYKNNHPDGLVFDASQGDGGASLPGVPPELLYRAYELQVEQGTSYDMPYGTDKFRKVVIENYWNLNSEFGWGPQNVLSTVGGRDALVKAYNAMLTLGYGRQGDFLLVSRVPWISYNWGPYGVGANVLLAPGNPDDGWAYSEDSIRSCVKFAEANGRNIAGLIITSPDNPTGRTLPIFEQANLARAALEAGVAFVLFDWIYHYVTDESPMDINEMLALFSSEERERLMFMDGITKSLGGSNIRNAHLIASKKVIDFIVARASHAVIPTFYSQAVAIAAYEIGYSIAAKTIIEPTNASRAVLRNYLDEKNYHYIMGKGYYTFIDIGNWIEKTDLADSVQFGEYAARDFGVAVVPGAFSSPFGNSWIRFSYATPPDRTLGAIKRLSQALASLE